MFRPAIVGACRGLILAALLGLGSTSALAIERGGASLGMTLADVATIYPAAVRARVHRGHGAVLELSDVVYADQPWSRVDLIFDGSDRLKSVTMFTRGLSFERLRKTVSVGINVAIDPEHDLSTVSAPIQPLQIRICDWGPRGVSLTYERDAPLT